MCINLLVPPCTTPDVSDRTGPKSKHAGLCSFKDLLTANILTTEFQSFLKFDLRGRFHRLAQVNWVSGGWLITGEWEAVTGCQTGNPQWHHHES